MARPEVLRWACIPCKHHTPFAKPQGVPPAREFMAMAIVRQFANRLGESGCQRRLGAKTWNWSRRTHSRMRGARIRDSKNATPVRAFPKLFSKAALRAKQFS